MRLRSMTERFACRRKGNGAKDQYLEVEYTYFAQIEVSVDPA